VKKEKKGKPPEQGGDSPFQRFEQLAKKIVSAPKPEKDNKENSSS
jgi:hypothetical protein